MAHSFYSPYLTKQTVDTTKDNTTDRKFGCAKTQSRGASLNPKQIATLIHSRPWKSESYEPRGNGIWNIPTMLSQEERKMLAYVTENIFNGEGAIVDLGCFLGGSTAFLAHGLAKNRHKPSAKVQSFDLFELGDFEKTSFFPSRNLEIPADHKTVEMFRQYIRPWADKVEINEGNLLDYQWSGGPIEVLFIDLMKSKELYNHVIQQFLPSLIPGSSIVILQDLLFVNSGPWHSILVEILSDKLQPVGHTRINSALYLCVEEITASDVQDCLWENVNDTDRIFYLAQNATRWQSIDHRQMILAILKQYLGDRKKYDREGSNYNVIGRSG